MKIEVGKFYKTRDGRKARIYAVDGRVHDERIHGAIWDNGFGLCGWAEDGSFYGDHSVSENDLVPEWEDPPEPEDKT